MRPKVMFLALRGKLPINKKILLSKSFDVRSAGVGPGESLIALAWKLRGHDVIVCQNTKLALVASLLSPETPIIVENHGDLPYTTQWIAKWMVRRAWALRSVSCHTARQFDVYFKPDGGWKYHQTFPAWTDEDLFWEAGALYRPYGLQTALYCGGPYDHKGNSMIRKVGHEVPVAHVWGLTQLELAREIARASVVVVPSEHEGLGLIALEAMMVGTPVVVSNIGGLRELVPPGKIRGTLVEPKDVSGWISAIKELFRDKQLCRHYSMEGKKFAGHYWTKDRYLDGYKSLVKEVLKHAS